MKKAPIKPKARRGFAAMSPELQRSIARQGGKAISKNKRWMATIGKLGGTNSHRGDGKR